MAEIIAYLFPQDGAFIRGKAVEAADPRITAGIHFESDKVAGLKMGKDVAGAVIERDKADGSQSPDTNRIAFSSIAPEA